MGKVWLVCLAWLMMLPVSAFADGDDTWEDYLEALFRCEDYDDETKEFFYEQLQELALHPVNINDCTADDLRQMPFLTEDAVSEIIQYTDFNGPWATKSELLAIRSLGFEQRKLLESFIYIGPKPQPRRASIGKLLKYGKQELVGAINVPLFERAGDSTAYLGYQYKHWFRYDFKSGRRLRFGLTGSQDAGEPFFGGPNSMGYDHYSPYLLLRDFGRLKTLAIGHYRLSYGMGLVLNTNFSLGKTTLLTTSGQRAAGIQACSSKSSAYYFQGAAASVALTGKLTADAFISYRPYDATLIGDTAISTLYPSAYHRTEADIAKKNNVHALAAGGNVRYIYRDIEVGITGVYSHYDKPFSLAKKKSAYQKYDPVGADFFNTGLHYSYTGHPFSFSGETAIDECGAVATVNTLSYNPSYRLTTTALYRYYSAKYNALYGKSMSESGHIKNENGAYLGIEWLLADEWTLVAYADYTRFAAARYQAKLKSYALDTSAKLTYRRGPLSASAQYRFHVREKDIPKDTTQLRPSFYHRMRLSAKYELTKSLAISTSVDFNIAGEETAEYGRQAGVSAIWRGSWLQLTANFNYFDVDSYAARVYGYEGGGLYTFSSLSFANHGIHYSLMAKAQVKKWLSLMIKASTTDYFNLSTIGSGNQAIGASSMTAIDIQARLTF